MSDNVIEFRSPAHPIAQFVRIDDTHRRFGDLYAAGKLPIRRATFDASRIQSQRDFVHALKRDRVEIVSDTEVAELAAPEKHQTHVKNAPWDLIGEGGLLHPAFFDGSYSQADLVNLIAEFAIQHGVDTILAPSHFLGDRAYANWLDLDINTCLALRDALDRMGAKHIALDYPILHTHTALNQVEIRDRIVERIADLPVDNLWICASGLGREPKPQTVKQFLASLYDLHRLDLPIIIDHVDGLMARSLLVFGGVSGLAHGIGERLRFDAGSWHKVPSERDENKPFGRTTYIEIPGLGRRLKSKEVELLATARGGHKYLGCQDACCTHGVRDMLSDPSQHAAYQAPMPIKRLSDVPDLNRESFFLDKPLRETEQLARNIKDLNPSKLEAGATGIDLDSRKRRLSGHHRKIGKLSDALRHLHHQREAGYSRAKPCEYRIRPELNRQEREQR